MEPEKSRWESLRSWLALTVSVVALTVSGWGQHHTWSKDRGNQRLQVMEWLEDARDLLSGREGASVIQRFSKDATKLELARRKIERARAAEPDNPEVHLYYGMYHEARGELEEAAAACEKAMELSKGPYWTPAVVCLGNVLMKQGRLDDAEGTLQAAAGQQPKSAVILANLCLVRSRERKLDEAGEACAEAVAIDPRSLAAQNNFGIVLLQQGNIEGAIKRFEAALAVDADSPEIQANLGLAELYAGHDEKALQELEKALKLDPSSGLVRKKLAALYREQGNELRAEVLEAGTYSPLEIQ